MMDCNKVKLTDHDWIIIFVELDLLDNLMYIVELVKFNA